MTALLRKAIAYQKTFPNWIIPKSRYPSLNYPRSRSELVSVLAITTQFWRIRWIGNRQEVSENESFWSASVQSHFWLGFEDRFLYISGFRLSLLLLWLDHLSTCYSPLFSKLRESTQGMAVVSRREVNYGVRRMLRFLSKLDCFSFLPILVQTV